MLGATISKPTMYKIVNISIHAPMLGATFQQLLELISFLISIHAPMLGATLKGWCNNERTKYFNPRPYVRSDLSTTSGIDFFLNFNPRPYVRSDFKRLVQ